MAARLEVDMVEVDVHLTRDGELVVRHDPIGRPGHHLSLQELRFADPVAMTLAEVDLSLAGRSRLLLDIKSSEVIEPLGHWLAAQPHPGRFTVCTPVVDDLVRLRQLAPAVDRWLTLPDVGYRRITAVRRAARALRRQGERGEWMGMARDLGRAVRDIRRERRAAVAALGSMPWREALPLELPQLIRLTGASGISIHHWLVTPRVVAAAHQSGALVTVWTVNRADALAAAVAAGADYVTTDDVEGMQLRLPFAERLVADERRLTKLSPRAAGGFRGLRSRLRSDAAIARGLPGE